MIQTGENQSTQTEKRAKTSATKNLTQPILVVARSKARVCGLHGNAGSNITADMDVTCKCVS
jgi:hypothetical protein